VLNLPLTAGVWVNTDLPEGVVKLVIKPRGPNEVRVAKSGDGTTYFTIPAGSSYTIDEMISKGAAGRTTTWFMSPVDNVLEVILWYGA